MLISTRSRYALRALARMVMVAGENGGVPVSLSLVSGEERVSIRYLEQIFGILRAGGLVKGKRGPGGGYVLGREPGEITVLEVVEMLETDFLPASCMAEGTTCSPEPGGEKRGCSLEKTCVTRPLWFIMKNMYCDLMGSITIEDLVERRVDRN